MLSPPPNSKIINYNTMPEKNPGLVLPTVSTKIYVHENIFGASREKPEPIGYLKEVMDSPLAKAGLKQYRIPSCVTCTIAWRTMYDSWKEGNDIRSAWRYIWARIPKSSKGSSPDKGMELVRKHGVCEDSYLPQVEAEKGWNYLNGDLSKLTEEIDANAGSFKLKNWAKIRDLRKPSLYAKMRDVGPLLIGIPGNSTDWSGKGVIRKRNVTKWYHMMVLLDWDEQGNMKCVNWNWFTNETDVIEIVTLANNYPVSLARSYIGLPDGVTKEQARTFMKLIKVGENPPVYFCDTSDILHPIKDMQTLKRAFGENAEKYIEVVKPEQIEEMEKGEIITYKGEIEVK